MAQLTAWLGLVVFVCGYLGVWWLPHGWAQVLCGVLATAGLAVTVGAILDAD